MDTTGEAEERFRLAMQNSAIGMCLISPEGAFLLVNPALCTILGRDAQDLVTCTWQQLTHPDDLGADEALVADVLAGRIDSYRLLKRYLRPDGSLVWGDLSVSCARDEHGAVRYFISQIVDVTERIVAEQALEASEQRYRLLVENSSDVVFRASNDGVLEWLSPSVTVTGGWLPEELVGRRFVDLVHPEDQPAVRFAQRRLARGRRDSLEARVQTRSGTYRWMSMSLAPIREASGAVVGRTGSLRDIEAEVEAREELESERQRYRILAENASDIVVRLGRAGQVLWIAPSVAEALGWTPDELVGNPFRDLLHPDDVEGARRHGLIRGSGRIGSDSAVLQRLRTKSGAYLWFSARATPVLDAKGTPDGIVAGLRDVDSLVRAERAAEDAVGRYRLLAERLQAVLDSMLDPHVLLRAVRDDSGRVVDLAIDYANDAALESLALARADVAVSTVRHLGTGPVGPGMRADLMRTLESGRPLVLDDHPVAGPEPESERRYDVRAARVDDALSVTWRDTTQRYEMSRRIAESEEQFRLLAESSSDVVLLARDGVMKWLSSALTRQLGWDPQEWVGHRFEEFTHPDDIELALQRRRQLNAGRPRVTRLRLRDAGGHHHWVEIHAAPFLNARGEQDGIVASFRLIQTPRGAPIDDERSKETPR